MDDATVPPKDRNAQAIPRKAAFLDSAFKSCSLTVPVTAQHARNDLHAVLTKGTHLVSEQAAAAIAAAVTRAEPLVEVELDLFGDETSGRRTTLATAHIVALTLNPAVEAGPSPADELTTARLRRTGC